jgi:hypothetical protein
MARSRSSVNRATAVPVWSTTWNSPTAAFLSAQPCSARATAKKSRMPPTALDFHGVAVWSIRQALAEAYAAGQAAAKRSKKRR